MTVKHDDTMRIDGDTNKGIMKYSSYCKTCVSDRSVEQTSKHMTCERRLNHLFGRRFTHCQSPP